MTTKRTTLHFALLLAAQASLPALAQAQAQAEAEAQAQAQAQAMLQVRVGASTVAQRLQSTTAAILVGRDEILRQGDASLAEVLKRQPGISVDGAPGKATIRMRGLGAGYVAMLLNGSPAPAGFALDTISPELVERIEILRAPTAETGGQAVAGAINIVLRKRASGQGPRNELKAGSGLAAGRASPSLEGRHAGQVGALAYSLTASLSRKQEVFGGNATSVGAAPDLPRHEAWRGRQIDERLELTPRLDWQPSTGDAFASQSWLRWKRIDNAKGERNDAPASSPGRFPRGADSYRAASPAQGYADLSWTRKPDQGGQLSAKLSGYAKRLDGHFLYRGMDADGRLLETHQVASGPFEHGWALNGSWRRPLLKTHALALGWELAHTRRSEYRRERQRDALGRPLRASDEDYQAMVRRGAFWLQDEWEPEADGPWSAYLGLRRETLHTSGAGSAHAAVDVGAAVWSPILQVLYKPGGEWQRAGQLRLALSRTYKAPDIVQLMPRRYTVDNGNSATNPDQQGNPNLRPELALGAELAWERRFGKQDLLAVSAYAKRIRDVTLQRVFAQDGVWITTPTNMGAALVRGLEFEGKRQYGALAGRVNLARNWSRLDAVAGPDNRLPGQSPWSGNLGLDHGAGAFELGGTWTWRAGQAARQNPLLAEYAGPKRQLDLYAVWKRDAGSRLRLAATDLLHPDYRERSVYANGADALATSYRHRSRGNWRLVWEQAL